MSQTPRPSNAPACERRVPVRMTSVPTLVLPALLLVLAGPAATMAQAPPAPSPQAQSAPAQASSQGMADMIGALRATPGVLGIELAKTQSGKQAIFAWFTNKQAVLAWFYSDAHQQMMRAFAPGASSGRQPLSEIADGSGPIMVIASLTYSNTSQVKGMQLPVSQIAIEMYAPLPGGLAVGGRFAPSALRVPALLEAPGAP